MEAADVLGALHAGNATVPGGRDLEGRPLLVVPVPSETQFWNKDHLDTVLRYFIFIFSAETRRNGLTLVLDATRSAWRMARACIRQVEVTMGADAAAIFVLRPEAFWDKQRVDNCARTQKEGEPVYIPLCRLHKYIDMSQVPEDLGGTWPYNHNQWIQNRIVCELLHVEAFIKEAEGVVSDLEKLRQQLTRFHAGVRVSSVEEALSFNREMFDTTKDLTHKVLEAGKELLQQIVADEDHRQRKEVLTPQDVLDTKDRVKRLLEIIHGKEALTEEAWLDMEKSFVDAKEISSLEEGVTRVTNWILGPAEMMLND
ncbi:SEC14 domain and spectrin repeat-containing protein 1, partial [Zootermopsis nevadensis]|uniref:SEC14 domain and spectrin repeat-containing protein 1 n=1 Tax=Zootermopsis nevadensis TaxID=136037 RepID=UPI000B8EC8CE